MSPSPRSNLTIIPTFAIEVDGVDMVKNGLSVRSISVDLSMDSFGRFSITLDGSSDPTRRTEWIDSDMFTVGKKVSVKIGNGPNDLTTMIVGGISSVKANFPSDGAPSVEIMGDDPGGFVISKNRRNAMVTKRYGDELLSLSLVIERGTIKGIGECIGASNILPGITLKLEGLEKKFSRTYQVLGSKHTITRELGYRTSITVTAK